MQDIGEKKFINEIVRKYITNKLNFLDDVFYVRINDVYLVLNVDGFSFSSSKYPWMDYYDIGWKAVTAGVSDLIAKNAKPLFIMVSIGLKKSTLVSDGEELLRGIRDAALYYGAEFVGGDTNSGNDEWIDITVIGVTPNPIPLKSKDPGDYIIITGYYGITGLAHEFFKRQLKTKEEIIITHTKRPKARYELLEIFSKFRECVKISTDVSDGLAESLYKISYLNNVNIQLTNIPIHNYVLKICEELELDPLELALKGGEEFEVIFTIKPWCLDAITNKLEELKIPFTVGKINVLKSAGVYIGNKKLPQIVWDNFKGYTNLE